MSVLRNPHTAVRRGRSWCPPRRGLLTLAVLSLAFLLNSYASSPVRASAPPATVTLTIDYGDGKQRQFSELPATEKMVVLDVLMAAAKQPQPLRFKSRGRGPTAFVTEIDGVKNEGTGKNWLYFVNGKLAAKGCGVQAVAPGDAVLWKFGKLPKSKP